MIILCYGSCLRTTGGRLQKWYACKLGGKNNLKSLRQDRTQSLGISADAGNQPGPQDSPLDLQSDEGHFGDLEDIAEMGKESPRSPLQHAPLFFFGVAIAPSHCWRHGTLGNALTPWSYDAAWDSHRVLSEITDFYSVVSSVPYPLEPLFYHTSPWFRTVYLLHTLSTFENGSSANGLVLFVNPAIRR
jgi:hypothetical protein